MKNVLNHASQCIAGFSAVICFLKFLDNLDILYLAGIAICIALVVGLRKAPNSGNLSISDTMNDNEKHFYSLSKASICCILACGAATPFLFGMRYPRSEIEIYIFIALIPIGLLFGALLAAMYRLAHPFLSRMIKYLQNIA